MDYTNVLALLGGLSDILVMVVLLIATPTVFFIIDWLLKQSDRLFQKK